MIYINHTFIAVALLIILVILAVIGIFALYVIAVYYQEGSDRISDNKKSE